MTSRRRGKAPADDAELLRLTIEVGRAFALLYAPPAAARDLPPRRELIQELRDRVCDLERALACRAPSEVQRQALWQIAAVATGLLQDQVIARKNAATTGRKGVERLPADLERLIASETRLLLAEGGRFNRSEIARRVARRLGSGAPSARTIRRLVPDLAKGFLRPK